MAVTMNFQEEPIDLVTSLHLPLARDVLKRRRERDLLFARALFCNPSRALFPLAMTSTYRLPNHRL
jgi:hypothetical protein